MAQGWKKIELYIAKNFFFGLALFQSLGIFKKINKSQRGEKCSNIIKFEFRLSLICGLTGKALPM